MRGFRAKRLIILSLALYAILFAVAPVRVKADVLFGETLTMYNKSVYAVKKDMTVWKLTEVSQPWEPCVVTTLQVARDVVGLTLESIRVSSLRHRLRLVGIRSDGTRTLIDEMVTDFLPEEVGTYQYELMMSGEIAKHYYLEPGVGKSRFLQAYITSDRVLKIDPPTSQGFPANVANNRIAEGAKYSMVPNGRETQDLKGYFVDADDNLWCANLNIDAIYVASQKLIRDQNLLIPDVAIPGTTKISAFLNSTKIRFDYEPIVERGVVTVPVRTLAEFFGASVSWTEGTQTATVRLGSSIVTLKLGASTIFVNGAQSKLVVPAKIIDGRLFAPITPIAEALGASVVWDAKAQTIFMTK
ncbi:MAG: copper amine oxidase N-terminal domain-containing protein [Clostridiales bacterium]|jgi:hypothetical protein|nr:copper amine oxidase N-terminal domain-containing protein [Clostridiales bacterium]MDR2752675.1 copper amine oxidase N-terminal domain-containing protein [Clostridiales bacterium]